MSTLQANEVEFAKMIVANVMGRAVTQGELKVAFEAVADKVNWKMPIDAVVDLDPYTMAMVKEAVVFFTGSVAKFKALTGTTTDGIGRYRVTAAGYYAAIGA
jgi:hypothetical protein